MLVKLEWFGYTVRWKKYDNAYDNALSRFHTTPKRNGRTDRQTDGRTDGQICYIISVCWRAIKIIILLIFNGKSRRCNGTFTNVLFHRNHQVFIGGCQNATRQEHTNQPKKHWQPKTKPQDYCRSEVKPRPTSKKALLEPASRVPYLMRVCLTRSSEDLIGVSMRSTVKNAAKFAVYVDISIRVKNHHELPAIRPDNDLQDVRCVSPSNRLSVDEIGERYSQIPVTAYEFLFVFHCNYGRNLYRFRTKVR